MNAATRDVVIAGGALAGSLAALALGRLGLAVTLVEARAPSPKGARESGDGRSISLSLASVQVLESLDLWSALAAEATPINTVHVSEAGRFGQMRLIAREMGVAALGQVVPAEALLAAIAQAASAAGVERISPAEVTAAPLVGEAREVVIHSVGGENRTFAARLLLIADGAGSTLRAELGIGARERRYDATAWVTTAHAAHPQPGVAFERFTCEGTLAILPRGGKNVGVVWTLPDARTDEFAVLEPQAFLDRVGDALGGRLGALAPAAAIRRFPLRAIRARKQSAARAVVIGNAAHSLHPVAAQGFNLTVRDIAALAECVGEAPEDPGVARILENYARARRRDQACTQTFTGIARGLGDWHMPFASSARGAGFFACEMFRPLARECARQGMGLAQRPLPALVRGARP
ncbi:MAG: FAD-dependent monooxygenase [Gammaproteobacteria bacterium]